jgi:hypothetical protein
MSNFIQPTIHPNTGNVEDATWHDNYFGHHRYGVEFADGAIFPESAVKIAELVKDQTPLGAEFEKVWDDNVERLYEK